MARSEKEIYGSGCMFRGEFQHSLDSKGRVIIPSKFREELGEEFVVTKGLDNCLFIYSLSEWENFENKLKELPLSNKDARAFVRFFMAGASECTTDKMGRTLLPQNLRDYAKLEKDIIMIGVLSRVEVWDKELWNKYSAEDNLQADLIAEKMAELGLGI